MPKMKTHKGARNRFSVTSRGKVKFKRSFAGHLMSGKAGKRARRARKACYLTPVLAAKIRVLIGA